MLETCKRERSMSIGDAGESHKEPSKSLYKTELSLLYSLVIPTLVTEPTGTFSKATRSPPERDPGKEESSVARGLV